MTGETRAPSDVWLGCSLLALAGLVDAVAVVVLKGAFVAFMSGNTTIAASSAATGDWGVAGLAFGLLGLFFSGVIGGAAIARWGGPRSHRATMLLIAAVTTAGTVVACTVSESAGVVTIAFAAGLINAVLASGSDVNVGLTFVTGTLVKAAHRLVDGIGTEHPWAWLATFGYWAVFAGGAVVGGATYARWGAPALIIAVVVAAIACVLPHRR